jgi:NitT/TauT family transport system substrate-binding protein
VIVSRTHRTRPVSGVIGVVAAVVALVVAACSSAGSPGTSGGAGASPGFSCGPAPTGLTPLTVGLGYIPSVQFAPFYLAQAACYYQDAGLAVTFQNKIETDLVLLVGQGDIDIGVADGTDVIPAVSQGVPVRYITTIYGVYPSIVFAKATSGIVGAADLRGRKIGIPGRYGSSWIMLQALLESAGMKPDDVMVQEYPDFGQGVAVQQGVVAAATGFANNEPVQLELGGTKAVVLHVDDVVRLPGPGLIASTATIDAKRAAIAAFVAATIRAMNDIFTNQAKGLDASIAAVPDLGTNRAVQAAILKATIETWPGTGYGIGGETFGGIDRAGWAASIAYMTKLGLVPKPVTVDDLVDATLLPAPGA